MTDATADAPPPAPRRGRLPLIIGLALALLAGGGGFHAVYSGLLDDLLGRLTGDSQPAAPALGDGVFMELAPLTVSIGALGQTRHIRFAATLEVPRRHEADVARLMPRILDVLNGYLRAVEPEEFGRPGALIRLRAQMLRRIQIVAGDGRVRDLLITEFVLN